MNFVLFIPVFGKFQNLCQPHFFYKGCDQPLAWQTSQPGGQRDEHLEWPYHDYDWMDHKG